MSIIEILLEIFLLGYSFFLFFLFLSFLFLYILTNIQFFSHYRSTPFEASLEVTPRYPLFGGWKSKWYHGYNLPLSQALQHKDSTYILNFLFVAPFEEAVIDDFTLRVTLPEGATYYFLFFFFFFLFLFLFQLKKKKKKKKKKFYFLFFFFFFFFFFFSYIRLR